LNVANGGTGTSTVGAAGSLAYSNGTALSYTTVGTAGQLLVSGGAGSPTWTSTFPAAINVPFNQISSGTNTTAAMTVGNGATLAPTGTGTITSNQFVGAASITGAVDLATTEVNGTLGVTNGGTGSAAVGSAGTIVYSNGTQYSFSPVGTTGQILTSNGAGAPSWSTVITAKAAGRVQGDGTNFSYTVTPGGGYTATSPVVISLESAINQSLTVTARTATTFTVQSPTVLSAADFIGWVVY
jgi:filamentous hemagglutinin